MPRSGPRHNGIGGSTKSTDGHDLQNIVFRLGGMTGKICPVRVKFIAKCGQTLSVKLPRKGRKAAKLIDEFLGFDT